jgi:hypothetical protein
MTAAEVLQAVLRHPLTTLAFGAILTGIVVPRITRGWQLRQKRLEVKVALVTELSERVVRFLMAIQFVRMRAKSLTQEQFDEAYREWQVGSRVLATKLEAYLVDGDLAAEWLRFADAMEAFYAIEGIVPAERPAHEERLRAALGAYLPPAESDPWGRNRDALLAWKAALVRALMRARIELVA